jgi:hypothetical protein
MNNPVRMHVLPLGMPGDGHDRIAIDDETLFLTGDVALEFKLLVFYVLIMNDDI